MFQVILKRWIRWSDDDNNALEFVVWKGTRKKEARGQIKALTHSIKEMMERHGWSDGQRFDPDKGILQYWDDEGVWFEQTFSLEGHKCIETLVCGEMLCGICFAERMETEKLVAPKRPPVEMTFVHKNVQRKK